MTGGRVSLTEVLISFSASNYPRRMIDNCIPEKMQNRPCKDKTEKVSASTT